jgi:hypothetical protein
MNQPCALGVLPRSRLKLAVASKRKRDRLEGRILFSKATACSYGNSKSFLHHSASPPHDICHVYGMTAIRCESLAPTNTVKLSNRGHPQSIDTSPQH